MKTVLELEDLATHAIKAALSQQWPQAIDLNQQILTEDPQSVEAANRLARAYHEQGELELAKTTYKKVLAIDAYNAIAQKNLAKLELGGTQISKAISQEAFLEEPGKTRTAKMVDLQKKRLASLTSGEKLGLEPHQGRLALTTSHGGVVGFIEDDLASHLLNLMHLGNIYSAHLMNTTGAPQVFLRETSQSEKAAKFVSFARAHTTPLNPSSVKSGLGDDFVAGEEDGENWEGDNLGDENSDESPDDDFSSMSLESMREEEDTDYGSNRGARDDY
jgi:tetratricopeptide (TPR) repeat protein